MAPHPSAQTSAVTVAPANKKDLGVLTLTNDYETDVDLGAGKSCSFKPNVLDHHNLALTMAFELRNSTGGTSNLNVIQVVVPEGKPLEVAIGDTDLTLTPVVGE